MTIWTDRDLPALVFLNENPPEHEILSTDWISTNPHSALPGISEQQFHYAVERLVDAGYAAHGQREIDGAGGVMWIDFQVTGAGKQVLGDWPMFAALGQPAELAALLDGLAVLAATDEEENNLRKAAGGVRKLSRDALAQFTASALDTLARSQLG